MKVKLDQSPQEIPGCVKLDSGDELSEHFSLVPRKHVHIVVEVPPPPSREYLRYHPGCHELSLSALYPCTCLLHSRPQA